MPEESSFTNEDRRILAKVDTEIRYLKEDFDELKKEIRGNASPSREDFRSLQSDVRNLQNFRWYILGAAVSAGSLIHFLMDAFTKR